MIRLIFCVLLCITITLSFACANDNEPLICNVARASDEFVGRENDLKEIKKRFASGEKIVTVAGMAGMGKTQLAKKYVDRFYSQYDIIWWLDSKRNLADQYKELAIEWNKAKKLEKINIASVPEQEITKQLKDKLRLTKLNWLLIFDNADNKLTLEEYFPLKHTKKAGNIMVTTKNANFQSNIMTLNKFERKDSINLLNNLTDNIYSKEVNNLAELLKDYPIAVSRAGLYLRNHPSISLAEYIELFKNRRKELWEKEIFAMKGVSSKYGFDEDHATAMTAILLSTEDLKNNYKNETNDEIKEQQKEISELAYKLLVLCSYIHSQNIPDYLLKEYIIKIEHKTVFKADLAIDELRRYYLLEKNKIKNLKDKDESFNIHEMVQFAVQDTLEKDKIKLFLTHSINTLNNLFSQQIEELIVFILRHPYMLEHANVLSYNAEKKVY
jgi:hypothetical protein